MCVGSAGFIPALWRQSRQISVGFGLVRVKPGDCVSKKKKNRAGRVLFVKSKPTPYCYTPFIGLNPCKNLLILGIVVV